ncbi:MAG: efflux RND transporter permease subunit, partial [Tannerella sp.]|nr:efflux RND transporter permease subunit [Tannerella sp.]
MKFLLNRKIGIIMLFTALTLLGYISFKQLPLELVPNPELPSLTVSVRSDQDMDPVYVEQEVIIPLEGAIGSIGGVDEITSQINGGNSTITVKFKSNVNIKTTSLKLEEKMKEVTSTLPEGFTLRVQSGEVLSMQSSTYYMTLQVRGTGGIDRVRNIVDERIATELQNIDGVAAVTVFGGRTKSVEVQIDREACKALNLTPSQIATRLSSQAQEKVFVGNVTDHESQYFVHVNSSYSSIADIENVIIAPGPVLLKHVATVFSDYQDETSYSRVNGLESVSISLVSDAQANLIDLATRTTNLINVLNERLKGLDIEIAIDSNTAEEMENTLNSIVQNAFLGGLLAVCVLLFFLRNLRLVVIITLAIPISVFTAFNFFYAAGITINSLTLIGIALAVGILLDNSIVVLENIYRLSGTGMKPERAVIQGITEVWRSIVAATLTTVVLFIPFIFTDNFLIKLIG